MDDSMEVSDYEVNASSDFEPAPKAKKAAPAKKAAAPKPKATKQTTLKATKAAPKAKAPAKKRAKPDSDEENSDGGANSANDDSLLSNTPPSAKKQKKAPGRPAKASKAPLAEVENESFIMEPPEETRPLAAKKNKTTTDQYQKLTHLEQILKRPDTYIGSVERTVDPMWVYNSDTEAMESRKVSYVPGLYKIFDEILVNATDNKQRDKNMNELRVWVKKEGGVIAVKNNGRGIPIEIHEKEGIFIPEMIFGHLLTSSNYDDDEAKVTGGRNGYGAKLTNIFSTHFALETVDSRQKKKYKQTWRNNMGKMDTAKIESCKDEDYTQITFKPDFSKFGMDGMDDDFEALVKRRVYDMAGTCKDVKVYLNDKRIKVSKFKQYMEMYTKAIKTENLENDGKAPEQVILTDNPHERWEIGFAVSDGSFQQVSFVNSIATSSGGTHVNYIADQICENLETIVNKKNKGGVKLKKAQIKNHLFLFVNCLVVNPAFTSQTKEQLTTKPSQFGSKPQVSDKFLKDISKTEAVNNIIHFAQQKADKVLAKSDGNRRQRMNNSKLTDANLAGTKHGHECVLILTEGDSAALLALAGRAHINPDKFGVFPLRGKMLNVRDASIDQISKNAEIQNIKKFVGLQHKKEYTDTKQLRYGHIMIMTDQDHDGSHIKGLLINFLQCQYPCLLKIPGFLMEFITPIVRVWKGDVKHPKAKRDFFTMPEYESWKEEPGHQKGWEHKYYKGLGTSDPKTDALEYFSDLDKHLKTFAKIKEGEGEMIDLAFSKKKADARKQWLGDFVPGTYLDMSTTKDITYDDFINKELILFSMADNMRSIPSVIDGWKPGQRKILYTALRRNLKKDVKVVELGGLVSGLTAYAYGDASLQGTIVAMAQNFVGSNNINILEPSGNFGSRLQGGSDAASARYIYTRLSPFARRIFHQSDEALLTYNTDDGHTIEPEMYIPVVPMVLINGADGIGTGWSTQIPNFNPLDVIANLKKRLAGDGKDSMEPMVPWFRGWTGETLELGEGKFKFNGIINESGDCEVEITELPIRVWTQDFKERLEEIIKAEKVPSFIKDYTEYNTPEKVRFVIKIEEKKMKESMNKLEELFKLSKSMSTTNLVAFDPQGRIHKYATPLDIMEEFYHVRIKTYQKRKQHMLSEMQKDLDKLTNQARFVQMIIDNKLTVSKKKKGVLVNELQKLNFKRFPKIVDARKEGELEAVVNDDENDESDNAEAEAGANDYDYLLGMAIWSLTQERVEKLQRQIGDKEEEINILISKSDKDLWAEDLDALAVEWQTQIEEEAAREKKAKAKGRRASAKLGMPGAGKGAKKRKAADSDDYSDSDFAVSKKAKAAAKPKGAVSGLLAAHGAPNGVEQKPVVKPPTDQMTLDGAFDAVKPLEKPQPKKATAQASAASKAAPKKAAKKVIDSDDEDDDAPAPAAKPASAATKPAPKKAAKKVESDAEDDDDEDVFAAVAKEASSKPSQAPARKGRAAASKPKKYAAESDDSDSEMEDDKVGDLSTMVRGIGGSTNEGATRLYHPPSVSRPSSSQGANTAASKAKPVKKPAALQGSDISEDETNWDALEQNSPQKVSRGRDWSENEDSMDLDDKPAPKAKAALAKAKAPAAKGKETAALKPKKAPAPAPAPVAKPQSPAAKAYAKKLAAKSGTSSTDTKAGAAQSKAKPSAAKKSKVVLSDLDDSDDEGDKLANDILSSDEEDAPPSKKGPAVGGRAPRRAAAAAPKKSVYAEESDEEEEESEEDEGSGFVVDDDSD